MVYPINKYSTQNNVKTFFRYLVEASKQLKERDEAREDLAEQIEKVSKISINKRTSKERIEKELFLLVKKIEAVIEKEKKFAMIHKIDVKLGAELRKEQKRNEELLKDIANSLSIIKLRLKHAKGLKEPIEELEKKIKIPKEIKKKRVAKKKKQVKKKGKKITEKKGQKIMKAKKKVITKKRVIKKKTNKKTKGAKQKSLIKNKAKKSTEKNKESVLLVSKEKIKLLKKELQLLKKKYSIMEKAKRSKKELDKVKRKIKEVEKIIS